MDEISMIAVDLAKRVFQLHGVNAVGEVCLKRRLRRSQLIEFFTTLKPCVIGMEACATAHYWARQLGALGHEVRLIPPIYVKPFVQRQKNDAADAAAICEAMSRPSIRRVPVKTEEQQATQVALRARELLVRQHHVDQRIARSSCRIRDYRAGGTQLRRSAFRTPHRSKASNSVLRSRRSASAGAANRG